MNLVICNDHWTVKVLCRRVPPDAEPANGSQIRLHYVFIYTWSLTCHSSFKHDSQVNVSHPFFIFRSISFSFVCVHIEGTSFPSFRHHVCSMVMITSLLIRLRVLVAPRVTLFYYIFERCSWTAPQFSLIMSKVFRTSADAFFFFFFQCLFFLFW